MEAKIMTIWGNIGQDPVLKFGETGTAYTKFSVFFTPDYKNKEDSYWIGVTAFGTLGENIAYSLKKGDRVLVHGRLEVEEVDDKTYYNMIADYAGPELRFKHCVIIKEETLTDKPEAKKSTSPSKKKASFL